MFREDVASVSRGILADVIGEDDETDSDYWLKIPATVIGDQSAEICVSLRQLQHRRGCSNALLEDVLRTMSPYLQCLGPAKITEEDKKMQKQSGVESWPLDGCVECNNFIFLPNDKRTECPFCGAKRYKTNGEAKERIWYFPIKRRLMALMKLKSFARSVNYEKIRNFNSSYITDVYDSESWKEQTQQQDSQANEMDIEDNGRCIAICFCLLYATCMYVCFSLTYYYHNFCTDHVDKMGLQYSSDGVKAFTNRSKSFTPTEFRILSLPPAERFNPNNMIIHMIHESGLKQLQLAKYYDFAVQHELSDLYKRGLPGTPIK